MYFEWDERKNRQNVIKHGLDFQDAQEIFNNPMLVEIDERQNYGEERYIGIGFLQNRVVVVVFTEKTENVIRIISLRKALKYECRKFEQAISNRLG
jgi:uncharacterized DUF497 family protein